MFRAGASAVCLAGMMAPAAVAQLGPGDFTMKAIPAPAEPNAIPLYAGVPPGSEAATKAETWREVLNGRVVRNVTRPTITTYLPTKEKATGAAVIVAPGGGLMLLSIDNEGEDVARWLADRGVAAFVLKYRLNASPEDDVEFGKIMANMARPPAAAPPPPRSGNALAFDDAQQAVRLVRSRAREWGVDPKRVGMVGFSAGAGTILQTVLRDDAASKPDFVGLIYGGLSEMKLPAKLPPLFTAVAADDALIVRGGFGLVSAWNQSGSSAELHVYEKGGHGFGMTRQGFTSDNWADQFFAWIKSNGFLD